MTALIAEEQNSHRKPMCGIRLPSPYLPLQTRRNSSVNAGRWSRAFHLCDLWSADRPYGRTCAFPSPDARPASVTAEHAHRAHHDGVSAPILGSLGDAAVVCKTNSGRGAVVGLSGRLPGSPRIGRVPNGGTKCKMHEGGSGRLPD